MRKFFVEGNQIQGEIVTITGEDVNHIKNVLRLTKGNVIQICYAQQNYICEIVEITRAQVTCHILEVSEKVTESNVELHIFQGLPKADKMELIIQKGTELGVSKFVPVALKRSVVKLETKDERKKQVRWQKIAEVAAKQSGRDKIPSIEAIQTIENVCEQIPQYDICLVAYEMEQVHTIKQALQALPLQKEYTIAVVIGPEGGLEAEEVEKLNMAGGEVVSLGKRILRTETVALQVASIIMYELETN